MGLPEHEVRATEVLKRLPGGPVIGAEIGVAAGRMSQVLLRDPDVFLYMVDSYKPIDEQPAAYVDSGDPMAQLTPKEQASNRTIAERLTEFASRRRVILQMDSLEAARRLASHRRTPYLLDFVFIDAAHDYASVKDDIAAWSLLVKQGGLIAGHDYDLEGVRYAVNEFAEMLGLEVELGENFTWFLRAK